MKMMEKNITSNSLVYSLNQTANNFPMVGQTSCVNSSIC